VLEIIEMDIFEDWEGLSQSTGHTQEDEVGGTLSNEVMISGLPVCMQRLLVNGVQGQETRLEVMRNGLPVCMKRLPVNGVQGHETRLEVMRNELPMCMQRLLVNGI
jgi:hypothetical protein